ncbi:hypothetical protein ROZALSC1DRAFT_22477 [Rozella allomycis CSF55]|uniref:Uncharacterized protein n=1 Tax=Rozella allomycis (strain CSF55) TaxID=988480 RepID=A0A4P9YI32_ROZAC|nr:hypothetical protein ROZALSC1DRAFT_22477 [Rozella allomycis CSF55]
MSTIIRIYNAVGVPLEQLFCQKLRFSAVGDSPHAPKIPDFQQLLIMAIIFLFKFQLVMAVNNLEYCFICYSGNSEIMYPGLLNKLSHNGFSLLFSNFMNSP